MRTHPGTIAALAVVLISPPAEAEVRVGALGGVNVAKLDSDEVEPDEVLSSKTYPAFGLVVEADLARRLSLVFEPMYVKKGSRVELRDFFGEDFAVSLNLEYIELPALLKVSGTAGRVRPYLLLGPSLGYRTGFTARDETTGEEESPDDADEMIAKWDVGLSAGGGVGVDVGARARVFAEARYTWGLSNINAEDPEDATIRNRGVQVLAGFTVALRR